MPAALIQVQFGRYPRLPPCLIEQDRIVGLIFVVGCTRNECGRSARGHRNAQSTIDQADEIRPQACVADRHIGREIGSE